MNRERVRHAPPCGPRRCCSSSPPRRPRRACGRTSRRCRSRCARRATTTARSTVCAGRGRAARCAASSAAAGSSPTASPGRRPGARSAGAGARAGAGGRSRPAIAAGTSPGCQFELARHGFPNGGADGGAGPRTIAALKRFQAWSGLGADGVAGPATRRALRKRPPQSPLQFYRPLGTAPGDLFGPRGATWHPGIDYPAASGTRIGAAGRGCVTFAGYDSGGYGNLVVIAHRLGMATFYAHLSSIAVRKGQCVIGHDPSAAWVRPGSPPDRTCTSRSVCVALRLTPAGRSCRQGQ